MNDTKLDFNSVLIRPFPSRITSRKDVNLVRHLEFKNGQTYSGIPIMAANMDGVGTFNMANTLSKMQLFTCLSKTYDTQSLIEFFKNAEFHVTENVAYSTGISNSDYEKFKTVYEEVGSKIKFICIDIANGYLNTFVEFISKIRKNYPQLVIMAGNVVTPEMTENVIRAGADCVKIGIGSGSACTTRIQTGVGYPQLSAIIESVNIADSMGAYIISDGGCTCPGDVAKAFAAGADFVMLGGMLSGHDEGGGEIITKYYPTGEYRNTGRPEEYRAYIPVIEKKRFVQFYGMSSKAANDKHFGGLKEYRTSEGREVLVPYRGKVQETVQDILGGLRSTCTYCNSSNLQELQKNSIFIRVTQQFNNVFSNDK
jgi:GMP reductase